jgi:cysteine synthase
LGYRCILKTTAPEIWEETNEQEYIFVLEMGSGGIVSDVG